MIEPLAPKVQTNDLKSYYRWNLFLTLWHTHFSPADVELLLQLTSFKQYDIVNVMKQNDLPEN